LETSGSRFAAVKNVFRGDNYRIAIERNCSFQQLPPPTSDIDGNSRWRPGNKNKAIGIDGYGYGIVNTRGINLVECIKKPENSCREKAEKHHCPVGPAQWLERGKQCSSYLPGIVQGN